MRRVASGPVRTGGARDRVRRGGVDAAEPCGSASRARRRAAAVAGGACRRCVHRGPALDASAVRRRDRRRVRVGTGCAGHEGRRGDVRRCSAAGGGNAADAGGRRGARAGQRRGGRGRRRRRSPRPRAPGPAGGRAIRPRRVRRLLAGARWPALLSDPGCREAALVAARDRAGTGRAWSAADARRVDGAPGHALRRARIAIGKEDRDPAATRGGGLRLRQAPSRGSAGA